MKLLAVETSSELCSVAAWCDSQLFVEEVLAPNEHAERLVPMVHAVLGRAGLQPRDLDAVAFGQGPGSFTGLRIACGLAQGIAFGADLPVVPVPSLLALAEQADAPRVVAALDARMGEVYFAAYVRGNDDWEAVREPELAVQGALPRLAGGDWVATGSGFDAFGWLRDAYAAQVSRAVAGDLPRAAGVARVAARRFARGEAIPAHEAAPLYLRDKVARTVQERQAAR